MTGVVPARARQLAGDLVAAFAEDQQLARALNDATSACTKPTASCGRACIPTRSGCSTTTPNHAAISEGSSVIAGLASDAVRFEHSVQEAEAVLLPKLQEVHWTIHRAFSEYQRFSEDRRHLAAEIGELIARLVDALIGAGWSEPDARNANVHQLAGAGEREA